MQKVKQYQAPTSESILEGNTKRVTSLETRASTLKAQLEEIKNLGGQNSALYAINNDKLDKLEQTKHEAKNLASSSEINQLETFELDSHNDRVQAMAKARKSGKDLKEVEKIIEARGEKNRFVFSKKGLKALRQNSCLRSTAYLIGDTLFGVNTKEGEKIALGAKKDLIFKDNNPKEDSLF